MRNDKIGKVGVAVLDPADVVTANIRTAILSKRDVEPEIGIRDAEPKDILHGFNNNLEDADASGSEN